MQSPYAYFKPTEKAGRFVAGRNNPGVGVPMLLSRREAQYDVDLGALVEAGLKAEAAAADADTLGGGGDETLPGGAGNDTVEGGGAANDTLSGEGSDTLGGGGEAKPKPAAPKRGGKAK